MTAPRKPFDAVLVVSFGGPLGMGDVRPFLANVLRGRRVPPARIDAVAEHYAHFEGISPITSLTFRQAAGLQARLRAYGPDLPVYVGMRNWQPFLADTLAEMARDGVRRALGFVTAAHRSYSSCGQYKQNVADARAALLAQGLPDVDVRFVSDWYAAEGFVLANATHIAEALARLPEGVRSEATVVFTAHSIPTPMAAESRYEANLDASARAVMGQLRPHDWAVVYQSRSGRPEDPWLGPDVCDFLREGHASGRLKAVVLCPLGFVSDHVEVLYDLDHEAAAVCASLGLPMARAKAANDAPPFLDLMADVVRQSYARNARGLRLPVVSGKVPAQVEGAPPARPAEITLAGRVDRVSLSAIPTWSPSGSDGHGG